MNFNVSNGSVAHSYQDIGTEMMYLINFSRFLGILRFFGRFNQERRYLAKWEISCFLVIKSVIWYNLTHFFMKLVHMPTYKGF